MQKNGLKLNQLHNFVFNTSSNILITKTTTNQHVTL
jgi:hypothetical protein